MKQPRPQVGDEWEVRIPFERKKVKIVGAVTTIMSMRLGRRIPYVQWKRLPKGRYSGITLRGLLQYGKRLSTKAERDKKVEERLGKLRLQPNPNERRTHQKREGH